MRLLIAALLITTLENDVTIRVNPRIVIAGGAVRITCHVPAVPPSSQDNLEIGLTGYQTSVREVHDTPWTIDVLFDHIPCDIDEAFCTFTSTDRETRIARHPIVVTRCNK